MVIIQNRAVVIQNLIADFIENGFSDLVSFEVIEDAYCIVLKIEPRNKKSCELEVTVGLCGAEHLTIVIGDKIVYEEYEGMELPEDSVFIVSLLTAVSKGRVQEKHIIRGGKFIDFGASVFIHNGLDIVISCEKNIENDTGIEVLIVDYHSW